MNTHTQVWIVCQRRQGKCINGDFVNGRRNGEKPTLVPDEALQAIFVNCGKTGLETNTLWDRDLSVKSELSPELKYVRCSALTGGRARFCVIKPESYGRQDLWSSNFRSNQVDTVSFKLAPVSGPPASLSSFITPNAGHIDHHKTVS